MIEPQTYKKKIDDYLEFGVAYVWVLNPRKLNAHVYSSQGMHAAIDGILRTQNPEIAVPLSAIF